MISERAREAIEASDTDDLLRVIDGLCDTDEWDSLEELKRRCREAVTRGKQLWGVEEHIRYRLVLEAPPRWAGAALGEGPARFALGPLPEVAASTKTWAEIAEHVSDGPWKEVLAAERAVRADPDVPDSGDLPAALAPWEPEYPVATYKSDKVDAPSPRSPEATPVELPDSFEVVDDPHSEGALADLVQQWATESNGRYQVVTTEGRAVSAIRGLGLRSAAVAEVPAGEAVAWMAWAAASGGANGRRRGAAHGRSSAWWALAVLCDLDWPPVPRQMADALNSLRFYWFDDGSPSSGWGLRLCLEDASSGLAWAVSANDEADQAST